MALAGKKSELFDFMHWFIYLISKSNKRACFVRSLDLKIKSTSV